MAHRVELAMRITLERVPWHTCHDTEPRYKYDAVIEVYGISMRSCRLNKTQIKVLRRAGVAVVRVPCIHCKKHRCTCLRGLRPKKKYESHTRKRT